MAQSNKGFKASVQKLGSHLSGMVMPNIGAFIAWGIITALFIPTGWLPNEELSSLVGPMQTYLLPLLIAYSAGNMVHAHRGGVIATVASMGVIVGSSVPMFIGAMMMGPFAAWVLKKFDEKFSDKIPSGFEMLVNNFSSGIIGFILAIIGYYAIGPVVTSMTNALATGVNTIVEANLLPLANVFIEPAKILFLNNAINHGILTPLGTQEVAEVGKSILYLLEANPGPGLGVLLAFMMFGKGAARASSPGAIIIHFFGGIHEIYFPYVMMKPLMFLAVIAGGVSGTFVLQTLGAGLSGAASPGSIIAILGMTAPGSHVAVLAGVATGALVSFLVGAVILKADKTVEADDSFEQSQAAIAAAKAESKGLPSDTVVKSDAVPSVDTIDRIVFACDAGMGSSAMGASLLRKKVKAAGLGLLVTNSAINSLKDDGKTLVITQEELTTRARKQAPSSTHVSVENFLDDKRYDQILADMQSGPSSVKKSEAVVEATDTVTETAAPYTKVRRVIFAHGDQIASSAMGASLLRNQAKKQGLNLVVTTSPLANIADDAHSLIITVADLSVAAKETAPSAQHLTLASLHEEGQYRDLVLKFK
ncbi:PTS mannitol transporter subunit IICBA [Fundicoccus sp. Sow4_F4]|uniref:PTS mannitol transporter subunit IICBA n=1 Tax=Fundicoccus sp. Sow4_F4 TaxID=3438783 RepID=UPI003F8F2B52